MEGIVMAQFDEIRVSTSVIWTYVHVSEICIPIVSLKFKVLKHHKHHIFNYHIQCLLLNNGYTDATYLNLD